MSTVGIPRSGKTAAIWRGFDHKWWFNHRANRYGSFVQNRFNHDGTCMATAVHAAASGSARDVARFRTYYTEVKRSEGIAFQSGVCPMAVLTIEEQPVVFKILIEVELPADMQNADTYAVVLNGFDLWAIGETQKLMTLALGVEYMDPQLVDVDGKQHLQFVLSGAFRGDCSSPECDEFWKKDLKAKKATLQSDHTWRDSAQALLDYVARIGREDNKEIQAYLRQPQSDPDVKRFSDKLAVDPHFYPHDDEKEGANPLPLPPNTIPIAYFTPSPSDVGAVYYFLAAHYLIVAGKDGALKVSHSGFVEKQEEEADGKKYAYSWTKKKPEIRAERGDIEVELARSTDHKSFVPAIKQFVLSAYRVVPEDDPPATEPLERLMRLNWPNDISMHLLDWTIKVDPVPEPDGPGKFMAKARVFFKNWWRGMHLSGLQRLKPPHVKSIFAYKDAGRVHNGIELTLLEFEKSEVCEHDTFHGFRNNAIKWPGSIHPLSLKPRPAVDRQATRKKEIPLS